MSTAAELLLAARRTGHCLAALPDDARPRTVDDAYAIQDAVVSNLGAIGAWKVGAKSARAVPTCAPLPASLVLRSPHRFAADRFADIGVEAELAFTLSRDLPPRSQPYCIEDVTVAIATMHPAIEIVNSRFVDPRAVDVLSLLADFHSNAALVLGIGVTLPHGFESSNQQVTLDIDGVHVVDSRGSNPAGDVLRLLAWLANHAASRNGGLRRGEVVTTGSWTGMRFVVQGAQVQAAFAGVGGVDVGF